jgi:serine/threonine protein phosphatase PrpC
MYPLGVGFTDVGRSRQLNEDSFYVDDERRVYVVADGMGGHASGEVASATAVESVAREVGKRHKQITAARDGKAPKETLIQLVREVVEQACSDVYNKASGDSELGGMGCTLTMLLFAGTKAVMAHVGDTRLYLSRRGKISQLSSDHTMAQELVLAGLLEQDEVADHRYAHVLSRALGPQPSVKIDTLLIDVVPGDRFMLCSDGLSEYIDDDSWLARQLHVSDDLDAIAQELVAFANAAGGHDNITSVVVEMCADDPEIEIVDEMSVDVSLRFDALGSVFLFESLSLALLARVLNHCEVLEYKQGDVAISEGDACSRMMVVLDGRFAVSHGDINDGVLDTGEHAGATTLLSPRRARATLTALGTARLLILERKPFWKLIKARPWLGVGLLERLGRRLSKDLDKSIEQRDDGDPSTTPIAPRERL